LSDIEVYEPLIRARLGTTAHFCKISINLKENYLAEMRSDSEEGSYFDTVSLNPRLEINREEEETFKQGGSRAAIAIGP